jgi:hypothetical protein
MQLTERRGYQRDCDGRSRNNATAADDVRTDAATLLGLADRARLGEQVTIARVQLDAMATYVAENSRESRARLLDEHAYYIATRYGLAVRAVASAASSTSTTGADAERNERNAMIDRTRTSPRQSRDSADATPTGADLEKRERQSMINRTARKRS